jgi:hypothetical protein
MVEEDIEIGITITPNIYLNIVDGVVPFNVDRITEVIPTDDGAIIKMLEPSSLVSSSLEVFEYKVYNNSNKIKEAIEDAKFYKLEGLNRIKELTKS